MDSGMTPMRDVHQHATVLSTVMTVNSILTSWAPAGPLKSKQRWKTQMFRYKYYSMRYKYE